MASSPSQLDKQTGLPLRPKGSGLLPLLPPGMGMQVIDTVRQKLRLNLAFSFRTESKMISAGIEPAAFSARSESCKGNVITATPRDQTLSHCPYHALSCETTCSSYLRGISRGAAPLALRRKGFPCPVSVLFEMSEALSL